MPTNDFIPFNRPFVAGTEAALVAVATQAGQLSGEGSHTKFGQTWLEKRTGAHKVLLTPSCTHALEMSALLLDIQPGDEVILPSYTFVSTGNAFALRGARLIFVDLDPATMNIAPQAIAEAISPKTKAIVLMHYGGVACDMEAIMAISEEYGIPVIEDAAHCLDAYFQRRHLGSFGPLGTLSFHQTKNIHCGEGGALLINHKEWIERAQIVREKGTNRKAFQEGRVQAYTWVDIGSSQLLGELPAAFLQGQLQAADQVLEQRLLRWNKYQSAFTPLEQKERIELVRIPREASPNGHLFYLKCQDKKERGALTRFLKERQIQAYFHYLPLHQSIAGQRYGTFRGSDQYTTKDSERLLRLPLYTTLKPEEQTRVIEAVFDFYHE
ncbi:MAG: dTDP-4-amino-4,6-dideoxygalactose transaminase [Bacteroidota bacterium]